MPSRRRRQLLCVVLFVYDRTHGTSRINRDLIIREFYLASPQWLDLLSSIDSVEISTSPRSENCRAENSTWTSDKCVMIFTEHVLIVRTMISIVTVTLMNHRFSSDGNEIVAQMLNKMDSRSRALLHCPARELSRSSVCTHSVACQSYALCKRCREDTFLPYTSTRNEDPRFLIGQPRRASWTSLWRSWRLSLLLSYASDYLVSSLYLSCSADMPLSPFSSMMLLFRDTLSASLFFLHQFESLYTAELLSCVFSQG